MAIRLRISETRAYNNLSQLTRLTAVGPGGLLVDQEYRYPAAGQNNGRIASAKDWVSGEDVAYQYDDLQRLIAAAATGGVTWSRTFQYDGFGNLTGGTTDGQGWVQAVNAATNRLAGWTYDASGNPVAGGGIGNRTYDDENRLTYDSAMQNYYAYDHEGKRYRRQDNGQGYTEYYFYGIEGKLLMTCRLGCDASNLYFGGRLIRSQGQAVVTDRLGSVRWHATAGRSNYYPYGEERTATADGREKFGTYLRDPGWYGQMDYADQRYHLPGTGRFLTADPYMASGGAADPGSWNRYAYTRGDPVNRYDPQGLQDESPGYDPFEGLLSLMLSGLRDPFFENGQPAPLANVPGQLQGSTRWGREWAIEGLQKINSNPNCKATLSHSCPKQVLQSEIERSALL